MSNNPQLALVCFPFTICTRTLFIVAAGKAGVEDGAEYIGGSEIISPEGKVLAKAQTDGDELVVATIELSTITELKAKWDFMPDRRPEMYQALVQKEQTEQEEQ